MYSKNVGKHFHLCESIQSSFNLPGYRLQVWGLHICVNSNKALVISAPLINISDRDISKLVHAFCKTTMTWRKVHNALEYGGFQEYQDFDTKLIALRLNQAFCILISSVSVVSYTRGAESSFIFIFRSRLKLILELRAWDLTESNGVLISAAKVYGVPAKSILPICWKSQWLKIR